MQELDLEKIRQEIDKVDQQLADVLESRLHLVMQVAAYKKIQRTACKGQKP